MSSQYEPHPRRCRRDRCAGEGRRSTAPGASRAMQGAKDGPRPRAVRAQRMGRAAPGGRRRRGQRPRPPRGFMARVNGPRRAWKTPRTRSLPGRAPGLFCPAVHGPPGQAGGKPSQERPGSGGCWAGAGCSAPGQRSPRRARRPPSRCGGATPAPQLRSRTTLTRPATKPRRGTRPPPTTTPQVPRSTGPAGSASPPSSQHGRRFADGADPQAMIRYRLETGRGCRDQDHDEQAADGERERRGGSGRPAPG